MGECVHVCGAVVHRAQCATGEQHVYDSMHEVKNECSLGVDAYLLEIQLFYSASSMVDLSDQELEFRCNRKLLVCTSNFRSTKIYVEHLVRIHKTYLPVLACTPCASSLLSAVRIYMH